MEYKTQFNENMNDIYVYLYPGSLLGTRPGTVFLCGFPFMRLTFWISVLQKHCIRYFKTFALFRIKMKKEFYINATEWFPNMDEERSDDQRFSIKNEVWWRQNLQSFFSFLMYKSFLQVQAFWKIYIHHPHHKKKTSALAFTI